MTVKSKIEGRVKVLPCAFIDLSRSCLDESTRAMDTFHDTVSSARLWHEWSDKIGSAGHGPAGKEFLIVWAIWSAGKKPADSPDRGYHSFDSRAFAGCFWFQNKPLETQDDKKSSQY